MELWEGKRDRIVRRNRQERTAGMIEPTMDTDGYPTDETLKLIETWPMTQTNSLLDFIAKAWHFAEYGVSHKLTKQERICAMAFLDEKFLRLATCGWSGNESLIGAFERNQEAWFMTWCLSSRGGLYIFRYFDKQEMK